MHGANNGSGRSYRTAAVTLTGCATAGFRAQLTWDTGPSSDMDLHLIRPGGAPNTGNDCYFANCQGVPLEWGAAGAAGNPVLDVDDVEVNRWTSQALDTGVRDWWLVASVNIQTKTVTPINTYSVTTPALLGEVAAVAPRK